MQMIELIEESCARGCVPEEKRGGSLLLQNKVAT